MNDYVLCDMIYHLSNNPKYNWCVISKETMALELWLSKRCIHNMLDDLFEKWLILKDDVTKFLKTSDRWYNDFILYSAENAQVVQNLQYDSAKSAHNTVQKVHSDSAKSAHNNIDNNNIDNNTYNIDIYHLKKSWLEQALSDYNEMRKKIRKPMTEKAKELLLKKLEWYQESEQIDMLEEATLKCWQSVYPRDSKNSISNWSSRKKEFQKAVANYNFT